MGDRRGSTARTKATDIEPSTTAARVRALVEAGDVEGARRLCRDSVEPGGGAEPELAAWARVLAPPVATRGATASGRDRSREYEWLRKNSGHHPGCWLCLRGDELLAADSDPAKALADARARGDPGDILLTFEPGPETCST